jgi:hypothetical protein
MRYLGFQNSSISWEPEPATWATVTDNIAERDAAVVRRYVAVLRDRTMGNAAKDACLDDANRLRERGLTLLEIQNRFVSRCD